MTSGVINMPTISTSDLIGSQQSSGNTISTADLLGRDSQDTQQQSSISGTSELPDIQVKQKPVDPLNMTDHAALSFLDKPQDQKAYLQKKFQYVIPSDDKGNFMVGQSVDSLTPVNPQNSSTNLMTWLASQSSQIAPMVGMALGSEAGVPGAAAGSAAGTLVNKQIGKALGSTESAQKVAVDTAISGAFGGVGQKAAEMFGVAANKFIAPKLAQAVDGKLTQMVNNGQNTDGFINFIASTVHFASGADKNDVATLMKYGVNKTLNDPTISHPQAIIKIAQDILNSTQAKKKVLGEAVGLTNQELIDKAGKLSVDASPIHDYIKKEMQAHPGWGTVDGNIITINRNAANSADSTQLGNLLRSLGAEDVRTAYQAPQTSQFMRQAQDTAKALQFDINNPSHQPIIDKALGVKPGTLASELEKSVVGKQDFSISGARAFKLPANGKISVSQAVGTQDVFGQLADRESKTLSDDMKRVFTNVLYRDVNGNDSPLASQLSNVAKANGIDAYVANKTAYKNFMNSVETIQDYGLDPYSPKSMQDYAKHINDRGPVDTAALTNFENNVGKPVLDNLKRYGAVQKLSNFNPNFLRLGLIAGMVGSMMGDGNFEQRIGRGASFALGIPVGLKMSLRAVESSRGVASAGKQAFSQLIKLAPAVTSQSGAKVLQRLIGNTNNQ